MIPEYLWSSHAGETCTNAKCDQAIKQNPDTGKWFITMYHPGFNTTQNNGQGYDTFSEASRANFRHIKKGKP